MAKFSWLYRRISKIADRKKYSDDEKQKNRHKYEQSFTGDLMSYSALIGGSFTSKINSLAQIIRNAHYPSLGTYKERLLMSMIKQFIPKRYDVGTGFVIFPTEEIDSNNKPIGYKVLSGVEHIVSGQCDIIVYDSFDYAPIFQDGDFVVVRPESVRSIIEVKGTLNQESIDDFMEHFIDLGQKWHSCNKFYRKYLPGIRLSEVKLLMMAWQIKVNTEGYLETDGTKLRERIVKIYKEKVNKQELKFFPYLSSALIYNDCIVSPCFDLPDKLGFRTCRGKFIRYVKQQPQEDDKTIASLLAEIYISLESPFNQVFAFFDQEKENMKDKDMDVLPYEHEGFTEWLEENASDLLGCNERNKSILRRFGLNEHPNFG
ncbi:MAG: DUF6602 domain-containing protein [Nostoc sp.]